MQQLDRHDSVHGRPNNNFYSGHQLLLQFGPTLTFRRIILMTWDKQKSNKQKKKQSDFYADIAMELLDELKGYLRLVWRFTKDRFSIK